MARSMHQSLCLYTSLIVTLILLRFVHSETLMSDLLVLQSLKQLIDPASISPSSLLSTWNFDMDPCESKGAVFHGILCTVPLGHNKTSRITEIDLEQEGLEGFLTPEIGHLTELTVLNLSKNKFRGPLPNTIPNLTKLTSLLLSENFFTGTLPSRINRLKTLQTLDLSHNRLSGRILPEIYGCRSLIHLDLSHNGFSGTLPDLTGLRRLKTLNLRTNDLHGYLPGLPPKLTTLLMSHNRFSGRISTGKRLEHLRTLDLSDNRFTGAISSREIVQLPMLFHLNLSQNQLTRMEVDQYTGPSSLLRVVDVHGNRLQGRLPWNLVTYLNLTMIDLSHNMFSGRIPEDFGERLGSPWRSLFLDHNFLGGSLPPQFIRSNNEKTSALKATVSLAYNCLTCPSTIQLCRGGEQRPASECHNHGGRPR